MSIDTPLTCGVFIPEGSAVAGVLEASIAGSPATIWASSLDGQALGESRRILLTHLTDVQGNGTRYADDTRKVLMAWGKGMLVELGSARVSLSLSEPASYKVYALDGRGKRVRTIKASTRGGRLQFDISTDGPDGGRIYYELVR